MLPRIRRLFSTRRIKVCRALFRHPIRTHLHLTFPTKTPFSVTLRNGRQARFTKRDELFWTWFFSSERREPLDFTAHGEIVLSMGGTMAVVRPGSSDFFCLREIFIDDTYGLRSIRPGLDTVVDLGGNAGLFTCAMLRKTRRVVTVEPVLENYRQAHINIAANNGSLRDLYRYAMVGTSCPEVRVYRDTRRTGSHSIARGWVRGNGEYEAVAGISLRDLLLQTGIRTIDLLKSDIEGAEYDVFLKTPREVLRRIRAILMEVHLSQAFPPVLLRKLVAHLEQAGFDVRLSDAIPVAPPTGRRSFLLRATQGTEAPRKRPAIRAATR